jgi:RNA polymerase-binding transcription factor
MALTQKQRTHLEGRLKEERARALQSLNRSVQLNANETEEERSGDMSLMPTHQADRGTDTMQQELDASNETRISRELAEIDMALERLYRDPEHFGVCDDTGEEIPFERLDVIPWAHTCGPQET